MFVVTIIIIAGVLGLTWTESRQNWVPEIHLKTFKNEDSVYLRLLFTTSSIRHHVRTIMAASTLTDMFMWHVAEDFTQSRCIKTSIFLGYLALPASPPGRLSQSKATSGLFPRLIFTWCRLLLTWSKRGGMFHWLCSGGWQIDLEEVGGLLFATILQVNTDT